MLKMLFVFVFFKMSSYLAFLDAAVVAGKPQKGGQKTLSKQVHRNEAPALDSQLDHAERIVASLTSEIGAEETSKLLEALAKKTLRRSTDVHRSMLMAHSLVL